MPTDLLRLIEELHLDDDVGRHVVAVVLQGAEQVDAVSLGPAAWFQELTWTRFLFASASDPALVSAGALPPVPSASAGPSAGAGGLRLKSASVRLRTDFLRSGFGGSSVAAFDFSSSAAFASAVAFSLTARSTSARRSDDSVPFGALKTTSLPLTCQGPWVSTLPAGAGHQPIGSGRHGNRKKSEKREERPHRGSAHVTAPPSSCAR